MKHNYQLMIEFGVYSEEENPIPLEEYNRLRNTFIRRMRNSLRRMLTDMNFHYYFIDEQLTKLSTEEERQKRQLPEEEV